MAIKRINPNAKFEIVSVHDEAIEFETEQEREALKTGKKDKEGNDTYNPSRFDKYLEDFNIAELKLKEGVKPTFFVVRCLTNDEQAIISQKYQVMDVVSRTITFPKRHEMLLEIFNLACLGLKNEDGTVEKVSSGDLEYKVTTDVGAAISLMTTLGKNLKKA